MVKSVKFQSFARDFQQKIGCNFGSEWTFFRKSNSLASWDCIVSKELHSMVSSWKVYFIIQFIRARPHVFEFSDHPKIPKQTFFWGFWRFEKGSKHHFGLTCTQKPSPCHMECSGFFLNLILVYPRKSQQPQSCIKYTSQETWAEQV